MHTNDTGCPLCGSEPHTDFHRDKTRAYLRCDICRLVFVPRQFWLNAEDEKLRYDLHENSPEDEGYRRFLSRFTSPLLKQLSPNQKGLDFGCGPGPTVSVMLEEHGHNMSLFDPFYAPNPDALDDKYDFITTTEVVEHMYRPGEEFPRLIGMLKPGGLLGVMTKLVIDQNAFRGWHYIQDDTHICFYSRETFTYIAEKFHMDLSFPDKDVIFLQKY